MTKRQMSEQISEQKSKQMSEQKRFKSHVDPAVYGIFRRIYKLAKSRSFPIARSGFSCSGHVYEKGLPDQQKKEYYSMATGKVEKIHPGAYLYLLYRTKGKKYAEALKLHNKIAAIKSSRRGYKIIIESFNPSPQFPPTKQDIKTFEKGHDFILVRYELEFLKPFRKVKPEEAREAFRHFWQCISDIVWEYEKKKMFGLANLFSKRKREIIKPEHFSHRGLGKDLLFD